MRLETVTPPAAGLITADELKAQVRNPGSTETAVIDRCIAAATAKLDGREGDLNRALITRTCTLYLPCFWGGAARNLPLPPLQSVSAITYIDADGAEQTVDPAVYEVDAHSRIGSVRLAWGQSWPGDAAIRGDAVRITYVCGYGDAADDVPATIRHAALMLAGHLFQNREATSPGMEVRTVPKGYDSLIAAYVVDFIDGLGG